MATVPTSAKGTSPTDRAVDERGWQVAAIAVGVFAAAYVAAPVETSARDVATLFADAAAVALIVFGIVRYRPANPWAWGLIAGGLLAWGIGDAVWFLYTHAGEDPFPSAADVFYLAGYPLLAAGLVVGIRRRTQRSDARVLIDAAIVTVSAATIGWVYVVETWQAEDSGFDAVVAASYPIADVLLAAIAVRLALGGSWRDVRSLQLLLVAVAMTFVGDLIFALDDLRDLGLFRVSDAVLVLSIPVFGLAGSHRTMVELTEEAPVPAEEPTVARLLFLSGVALVPAAFIVVQAIRGATVHLPVAAAATLVLGVLMIIRFADLAANARRAARREAVVSGYARELLASSGREALYAHAEQTAKTLVDGRPALVVEPGDGGENGYAFRTAIPVRGEVVADLVADIDPHLLPRRRHLLDTVAAELSLALEREELLAGEREAAHALAEQNEQLRELDELKDQFVSTVTHELRTPLAAIVGYLELVLDGEAGELNETQTRFLEIVSRNCERLNQLVDDILTVARLDSGRFKLEREDVDLVELVAGEVESTRAAAERKQVELGFGAPEEPVVLSADPRRLAEVVGNLLSNAVKFTPEGGSVTVNVSREGDAAVLEVADTGVGVPAEEVGRLFERFFRASTAANIRGTGLGLSIARSIAEAHDGTLDVRSTEGAGTTFTLELPVAEARP